MPAAAVGSLLGRVAATDADRRQLRRSRSRPVDRGRRRGV